jgi:ATP-dependent exoDNAse (exonuclease V) beta subunit
MTIHRAKGLEFDVVILPALDRGARREDPPLLRAYELPILDDQALLLAPIAARGSEHDAIYKWLALLDKERERFERGRLLYVAATRAQRELHLFGVLESDGKARTDTFLQLLWPIVEPLFSAQSSEAALVQPPTQASAVSVTTRRLPLLWSIPKPLQPMNPAALHDVVGATPLLPLFEWAGETARHVGTLVHREIERMATAGFDSSDIQQNTGRYAIELAELGVPPHFREAASVRVRDALLEMQNDERGRWLLMGTAGGASTHREATSELALSGIIGGEIVNGIIDRTFVDQDGIRWIVDFKTSAHEGGGLQEFLDTEVERYGPQLQRYAQLMRGYRPKELIKAALYFPLLKAWREVPV